MIFVIVGIRSRFGATGRACAWGAAAVAFFVFARRRAAGAASGALSFVWVRRRFVVVDHCVVGVEGVDGLAVSPHVLIFVIGVAGCAEVLVVGVVVALGCVVFFVAVAVVELER